MIYWQLFCVQIYFFTPPKFIVPTFLPFSPYLPKSYFGQGWARAVLQKIAITIRIQRVTMSTKVVTMNINSSEKYSPRHLGIVASSSLWLSVAPLLINAGIWQTNKVLWSAMSLSGQMVLSACPSGLLTAEDDDVILESRFLLLWICSAQSSHLAFKNDSASGLDYFLCFALRPDITPL